MRWYQAWLLTNKHLKNGPLRICLGKRLSETLIESCFHCFPVLALWLSSTHSLIAVLSLGKQREPTVGFCKRMGDAFLCAFWEVFAGALHLEHGAFFLLCHVCVELHCPGLRALLAPDGLAKRDLARNHAVRESLEENKRERQHVHTLGCKYPLASYGC